MSQWTNHQIEINLGPAVCFFFFLFPESTKLKDAINSSSRSASAGQTTAFDMAPRRAWLFAPVSRGEHLMSAGLAINVVKVGEVALQLPALPPFALRDGSCAAGRVLGAQAEDKRWVMNR